MEAEKKAEIVKGRDTKTGQFAKGNNYRPKEWRGGGRPKKLDSTLVLEAITNEFEPGQVGQMVRDAYNIAVQMDDWKGVLEVARFIAAYAIGKPVQRSINLNGSAEEAFFRLFSGGGVGDIEEDAVDAEVDIPVDSEDGR